MQQDACLEVGRTFYGLGNSNGPGMAGMKGVCPYLDHLTPVLFVPTPFYYYGLFQVVRR